MKYVFSIIILLLAIAFFSWVIDKRYFREFSDFQIEDKEYKEFVVVWGKSLTDSLKKQLDVAVNLYKNNLVDYVIVSGNKKSDDGNVVIAMVDYLESNKVAISDIILDFHSPDIYSSTVRMQNVYGINNFYVIGDNLKLLRYLYFLDYPKTVKGLKVGKDYGWFTITWYKWKSLLVKKLFTPDVYIKDYDPNYLINNK